MEALPAYDTCPPGPLLVVISTRGREHSYNTGGPNRTICPEINVHLVGWADDLAPPLGGRRRLA